MEKCIYCGQDKEQNEFSLEHIIPQFLGGSQAPEQFKTRCVCKACNNNLGLFVDASFEKGFLVFNSLNSIAQAFYNPEKPTALPLQCMGEENLRLPRMADTEICEYWLGPLGEQIFWIRPKDKRLYWYSGGNPRTVKKAKSRAYFLFSTRSVKDLPLAKLSFKKAFEGKKVKKILCTSTDGFDIAKLGFSAPDSLDSERVQFLKDNCFNGEHRVGRIQYYMRHDLRFLAKLSIGMSFCLFGRKILNTPYLKKLNEALWFREGGDFPNIRGTTASECKNEELKQQLGMKNAIIITILSNAEGISINLNINIDQNWTIMCASSESLTKDDIDRVGNGICIILYKTLKRCITISLPKLLAHKAGNIVNSELIEIHEMEDKYQGYFENL